MAIDALRVVLRGYFPDGRPVTSRDMLERLDLAGSKVFPVIEGAGAWEATRVQFFSGDISEFEDEDEPYEVFAHRLESALVRASDWLQSVPLESFLAIREAGLVLDVLFNATIDADQLSLSLPPAFLAACGRAKLRIEIETND